MEKIISIVLPTYNRVEYLKLTLDHYKEQIERNYDSVEMIVCDNASTDGTKSLLHDYHKQHPFFKYLIYNDHVGIGLSIKRTISNATAQYILLWGDDDLPSPFMIDTLLHYIKKYPETGLIHFNRLAGYDNNVKHLSNLKILKNTFYNDAIIYNDLNEFIHLYYLDTSFLSSILFLRSGWEKGSEIDSSRHYGYEFLAPIYYGLKGKPFLYINFPIFIQRKPLDRSWLNMSPYYRFIGIPNLLYDFEKWGLLKDVRKLWMQEANSMKIFLHVIIQSSLDKKFYRPLAREINKHQYTIFRKILVYLFIYLFPADIYKGIRRVFITKK